MHTQTAVTLAGLSLAYPLALYTTAHTRASQEHNRNHPQVVRTRMLHVSAVTLLSIALVAGTQPRAESHGPLETLLGTGIVPGFLYNRSSGDGHANWRPRAYLAQIARALLLVGRLFVAPLSDAALYYAVRGSAVVRGDAHSAFAHICAVRDYVFAPITEEIVYTALLVTAAGSAVETDALVAYVYLPLLFGVAHVHHAYERYTSGGERNLFPLVCSTLVQTAYTSLFGAITNYTYIHTAHCLWACVLQHSLCNVLGLPGPSEVVQHYSVVRIPSRAVARRLVSLWGKAYIVLLPVGALWFVRELRAWE